MRFEGKTAIVTGGARGIGAAAAERIAAEGGRVLIADIDEAAGQETAAVIGPGALAYTLDVTSEDSWNGAVAAARDAWGRVDILVNNAGVAGDNVVSWEMPVAEWTRVIEIDLSGVFLGCRAVLPGMIEAGYGRIVNVASIAGKEGNPNASHYSASKAGLIGLTKSLGKELAQSNVMVNCITPAAAKTDIFHQMKPEFIQFMLSKIPMGRFVEVDEIAAMIAWLASEECSFTTGAVFDISGGRGTY